MVKLGNRPASEGNDELEEHGGWRNSWYRLDSDRHGRFYSYPRAEGRKIVGWAIWWEDSDDPVSCFLHGPLGSKGALLDAFLERDFLLREPLPARSS
jgi:hypothetical protein